MVGQCFARHKLQFFSSNYSLIGVVNVGENVSYYDCLQSDIINATKVRILTIIRGYSDASNIVNIYNIESNSTSSGNRMMWERRSFKFSKISL